MNNNRKYAYSPVVQEYIEKRKKTGKTSIKKEVLARILKSNYFPEKSRNECQILAGLFIKDDFPKNDITTYAEAFRFLDYLQDLRVLKMMGVKLGRA